MPLPSATIRTQVRAPLRFADGFNTVARVFSFVGLFDGQDHVAFARGDWAGHGHVCWPRARAHTLDIPLSAG
jgi:GTP cyclohydrolase II